MYRILFVILIFFIFIPLVWKLMNWLDKKIDKALNEEEMKMKDVIDEVNDAKQKLEDKEQEIKEMQKANDAEKDALKTFLNQKDNN